MRSLLAGCAIAALGCAELGPAELLLEGEETLLACAEQRVDTSLCLSLEVIQAEYELCLRQHPGESRCEEVWQGVAGLSSPAQLWSELPELRRGFRSEP